MASRLYLIKKKNLPGDGIHVMSHHCFCKSLYISITFCGSRPWGWIYLQMASTRYLNACFSYFNEIISYESSKDSHREIYTAFVCLCFPMWCLGVVLKS